MKRRKFIIMTGTTALGTAIIGAFPACKSEKKDFNGHHFPELGYSYDALEPNIDAQTMELHYSKHFQGYYNNFMNAIKGTELEKTPIEDIFAKISSKSKAVRNNGGGYYNHRLFWDNMTPNQEEMPKKLKDAIEKDLGSVEKFKSEFEAAAKTQFGSGWAWLVVDNQGKLFVTSTPNQDNPLMDIVKENGTPILALDVWEHAYYLKYQNRRPDYVANFWNVVNWQTVNSRFEIATK